MLKRSLFTILFFAVLFMPQSAKAGLSEFNRLYGELLQMYVQDTTIDGVKTSAINYKAWRNDERHEMAMDQLQSTPTPEDYNAALAFWINAYNFLTIDVVLQNDDDLDAIIYAGPYYASPFRHYNWDINGNTVTLDYIEDEILRATGEGFIAVALNQAAIYSPDLRKQPYEGDKILDQLSDQATEFLGNPNKGMRIEDGGIYLSKVFQNYQDLFGGMQGVFNFVVAHAPQDSVPNSFNGFMRFDWDLNALNTD